MVIILFVCVYRRRQELFSAFSHQYNIKRGREGGWGGWGREELGGGGGGSQFVI